ncbi:MAG: 2TM domain-containing protein [Cyanobacteria bacterium P01_F01_bin.150]
MSSRRPARPARYAHFSEREFNNRLNFATHISFCLAFNSGIWFFRLMKNADWSWAPWLTGIWLTILTVHGTYVYVIADYSEPTADS